jgi:hypothetical protein
MNKFEPTTSNYRSGQRETNPAPETRSCEFIVYCLKNKKELTSQKDVSTSFPETILAAPRRTQRPGLHLTPIERDAESATSDASRRALR